MLTCLISDSIGFGERAREFIHLVSQYLGTETGVGLRDYSVAVGRALDLLECGEGRSVIISPLSPVFYYDEITKRGLDVLYADVNPANGCMDPEAAARLKDYNPAAILLHFPLGFIPDLEPLRETGIPLILDVSTALGGAYRGRPFSQMADILILHLEEDGIITAGGGALVLSAERKTGQKLQKLLRELPPSSLLTDINASLGIIQFQQVESFLEKRYAIDEVFRLSLMKGRHTKMVQEDESSPVPFSFPVLLEGNIQDVRQYARKKNLQTKAAFGDAVFMQHGIDRFPCPNAVSIVKRCILFPLFPALSKKNIELISKVLTTLP